MPKAKLLTGDDLTLEQWLSFMKDRPKNIRFEDFMFPSDTIKDGFIANIHNYEEQDIKRILRKFLDFSRPLGSDHRNLESFLQLMKDDKEAAEELLRMSPYYRRLLQVAHSGGKQLLYDSILWALDLLPSSPRDALNVITAFGGIHLSHFPDGRIHGIFDAEDIIRARYFDARTDRSVLYSLTPDEFEHVVEALYHEMGYRTRMTKRSHDKGRDVIADKTLPGSKEHLVISCKRLRDNVEPADYREIMSSVDRERASKGVVVATSGFSAEAHKEADESPRMELIDQNTLQRMLNEHIGATWSAHLGFYISESRQRHPDEERI